MRMAELAMDIAAVGHNGPPSPIDDAKTAINDLSRFLTNLPVIETDEQAMQGKLHVDRTRATLGTLEDARDAQVRPLNERVKEINNEFKAVSAPLTRVLDELRARLTAFAKAEEIKREAAAEAARQAAFEAERLAREAEEREREAKENATFGEVANVGAAIVEADQAFAEFEKRTREAERADRETNVRIAGGFSGRALSMRTTETLVLESYSKAIKAIGKNEKIETAILSAARDYRKLKGSLPDGVTSVTERKI
jgi:hypothetical protein